MNISDVVRVLCGRDAGRFLMITGTDGEYVLLADGRHRRLEKPKRKKTKHVEWVASCESAAAGKLAQGQTVTNNELWRALAEYRGE